MADDKLAEGRRVHGSPAKTFAKITLSMDELDASLESFQVEPPTRGRVVAAQFDTAEHDCTGGGATCNFKCGATEYWECGETSIAQGCDSVQTCWSCVCTGPGYDTGC